MPEMLWMPYSLVRFHHHHHHHHRVNCKLFVPSFGKLWEGAFSAEGVEDDDEHNRATEDLTPLEPINSLS